MSCVLQFLSCLMKLIILSIFIKGYLRLKLGYMKICIRKMNSLYLVKLLAHWFRTITSQPTSLALQGFDHFLNQYGCVILETFCNSFFKKNFLYLDFPQHQFMSFRRCIFTHSKKLLLQISSYT